MDLIKCLKIQDHSLTVLFFWLSYKDFNPLKLFYKRALANIKLHWDAKKVNLQDTTIHQSN